MFLIACLFLQLKNEEVDKKYAGLLEKKWTSVIRLQKKVRISRRMLGRLLVQPAVVNLIFNALGLSTGD